MFLFDEHLSNLDAELHVNMRIEIAKLHEQLGNTMFYVPNGQIEAMTLADKIVVLCTGRIEQVGLPAELFDDRDNVFVAGFIGSPKMSFLDARIGETGDVLVGVHRLPAPSLSAAVVPGAKVALGVRPEHLRKARDRDPAVPFEMGFIEFLEGRLPSLRGNR